jgi:hypothetical protein
VPPKKRKKESQKNNENTYRGARIKIAFNCSSQTVQTNTEWNEILKVLR